MSFRVSALGTTDVSDYVDDAIHMRRHWWSRKTLCNQAARPRNVVTVGRERPDWYLGCWTCIQEEEKVT